MLIYIYQGVELLGVVAAAVASMLIGMLWYSRFLFSAKWMELIGMNKDNEKEARKRMNTSYAISFVCSLVIAYVLGLFIKNMFVPHAFQALLVGLFAWIGFVATTNSSEYLFSVKPKPWMLYVINTGYQLVCFLVSSVILFAFIR